MVRACSIAYPAVLSVAGALSITALAGCITSHVMVGPARPPIPADQVRVLLRAPAAKYEEIAVIETSSRSSFAVTSQGKTDKVIARLKKEAARLGANGLLLQDFDYQSAGSVGTGIEAATSSGNHGTLGIGFGVSGVMSQKSGNGLAIHIEPD
jgi:hypothetical protein